MFNVTRLFVRIKKVFGKFRTFWPARVIVERALYISPMYFNVYVNYLSGRAIFFSSALHDKVYATIFAQRLVGKLIRSPFGLTQIANFIFRVRQNFFNHWHDTVCYNNNYSLTYTSPDTKINVYSQFDSLRCFQYSNDFLDIWSRKSLNFSLILDLILDGLNIRYCNKLCVVTFKFVSFFDISNSFLKCNQIVENFEKR